MKVIKSLALAIVCGALAAWLFLLPAAQAWLTWGFAVLGVAYLAVGLQQLRAARKAQTGTYLKTGSGEAQPRRGSVEERSLHRVNEHRRRGRNAGSGRQKQF